MTKPELVPMNGFTNAEYFDVDSMAVGDRFRIFVAKPPFIQSGQTCPALIVLDANMMFGTVREIAGSLSMAGDIPGQFVIGIGYEDVMTAMTNRSRDFTPNEGGAVEAATLMGPKNFGGAPAFAKFIRDELLPLIAGVYPIDLDAVTLAGVSYGGLFVLWSLLTRQIKAQGYIAVSPSIWWNKEEVWQWEEQLTRESNDLSAKVFLTAGGLETAEQMKSALQRMSEGKGVLAEQVGRMKASYELHGWPRMAEITSPFAEKLKSRNYSGLQVLCHNLPDETHMSMFAPGLSRGIRYLYGDWSG